MRSLPRSLPDNVQTLLQTGDMTRGERPGVNNQGWNDHGIERYWAVLQLAVRIHLGRGPLLRRRETQIRALHSFDDIPDREYVESR